MYQTQHCILYLSIITFFFKREKEEDACQITYLEKYSASNFQTTLTQNM